MKESFWNMSTSIRNAERIPDFLQVATYIEGSQWDSNTQRKFQILLIQHRKYLYEDSTLVYKGLSDEQASWLKDKSLDMTFEQAKSIFESKNYKDPAMRGRQSLNPLQKLGLANVVDGKIVISDVGHKLHSGEITWDDFILDSFLKYQLPNPVTKGFTSWNIKPFIATLRLIKEVNQICAKNNKKEKGISIDEFGIFALTQKNYAEVRLVAQKLFDYRLGYEKIKQSDYATWREYENACKEYKEIFINSYLANFNNPIKNVHEYADSMVRYLRQTKYFRILGKYGNQYLDLEPRRMLEINSILEKDNGQSQKYSKEVWINYMGTYGMYELPFETIPALEKILENILSDIGELENKLQIPSQSFPTASDIPALKLLIDTAREYRTELQNKEIKVDYARDFSKIEDAITMLTAIDTKNKALLSNKFSVELEKWTNIALNILNDAKLIKPNSPVGDDNEPTFTAPANVPDIECYYDSFDAICEVTMLVGRDQWYNEGQPVMRHLRTFEEKNTSLPSYCLFIAPKIHVDTAETYWNSVLHGYQGRKQRIIPITIKQLIQLLETCKKLKIQGQDLEHKAIQNLYESCVDVQLFNDSSKWLGFIAEQIEEWKSKLLVA